MRPNSAPRTTHEPPPPPQLALGDGGDSGQLQQDLEQLQRGYAQAGGANTALLEMMARLQRDAQELAALPPLPSQPPQPPPPSQWLEGAERAGGAGGDAVPPEVARQLSAMQRALVAREEEAARLHEQLQSIRGGARGPLPPPPPVERPWADGPEASLGRRPSKGPAGEFEQVRGRSHPNPNPDH